jgi:O-antigen ligase/polysaccharide polymerase Wzy-like membrane protein
MMDGILALGLLFTTASQLRLPGVPIGPGELGLVVWIVAILFRTLLSGAPSSSRPRAVSDLLVFWGAFALALSLGMITAMATGEAFESDLVLHDAVAYALVAVVGCLCAAAPSRLRRVAWFLVISGAASLSLQYANGIGLIGVPGIDPWFWERFRGWSDNPNQLAILCLIIVLVAFYLADTATSLGTRLAAMLLMFPPLIVGRMSRSDAFMLALAAALAVWFAVKLIVWLHEDGLGLSRRASFARLALLAAPVLLLCLTPLVLSRAEEIKGFAMGFAKHAGAEAADEANLRLTLWRQAIGRGIDSGMMGLGPGPHLQMPLSIVAGRASIGTQPVNMSHPTQNGTANYEAHNTILDLFTQGGLLAVASFVWILLHATKYVYRARSAELMALVAGAAIFMMTGNIVRQPIFWFAIVLCLTAPAAPFERRGSCVDLGAVRRADSSIVQARP